MNMSRTYARLLVVWFAAVAMLSALGGSAGAETLLFKDTFNNTADASTYGDFGLNQELASRQSGTYANTTYVAGFGSSANASRVNNANAQPASAGMVSLHKPIALNHNFNGADAAGGLKYGMEVQQGDSANSWMIMGFGNNDAASATVATAHGLFISLDGTGKWYKNNVEQPGFTWLSPGPGTTKHLIEMVFRDTFDGNPFNGVGVGSLFIDVHVDGSPTPVTTFNWGDDPANNYIWIFNASGHSGFPGLNNFIDNLTLTNLTPVNNEIPEPSSLILAGLAALGGLFVVRRKARR